jgi:HD-GYP domain-containing protein (c-di-GMP phosphodiesterase class II)
VAIKNSRIFSADNTAAIQSISNLLSAIRDIIEAEGSLVLNVVHNYLVLNEKRVKADIAMMNCYSFVLAELQRIKVKSLAFESGVSEDDLGKFIYMLGGFEAKTQDPFQEFASRLAERGVRGITVGAEAEAEETVANHGIRERSTEVYFQSISVAREILTRAQTGRAVNFRMAKRVVQNMIDVALEEDYFLMSLTAIKNHDEYTFNHSANVCVMSVGFGQKLGLSKLALEALGIGALLHDIGKTDIPRKLLNKPGKLTDDEWELMRRHPTMGVKCLLRSPMTSVLLLRAILVCFEHHQRLDLSGYPEVKEKREQNLLSKIVEIADSYDALTTPRVYRRTAMKPPEAFRIMTKYSGDTFDPHLLKLFVSSVGLYPIGSLVKLDTGELGLVYSTNQQPQFIDRPLVKIVSDPSGKLEMNVIDLTDIDPSTGTFARTIVDYVTPSEYFEDLNDFLDML